MIDYIHEIITIFSFTPIMIDFKYAVNFYFYFGYLLFLIVLKDISFLI